MQVAVLLSTWTQSTNAPYCIPLQSCSYRCCCYRHNALILHVAMSKAGPLTFSSCANMHLGGTYLVCWCEAHISDDYSKKTRYQNFSKKLNRNSCCTCVTAKFTFSLHVRNSQSSQVSVRDYISLALSPYFRGQAFHLCTRLWNSTLPNTRYWYGEYRMSGTQPMKRNAPNRQKEQRIPSHTWRLFVNGHRRQNLKNNNWSVIHGQRLIDEK